MTQSRFPRKINYPYTEKLWQPIEVAEMSDPVCWVNVVTHERRDTDPMPHATVEWVSPENGTVHE